MTEASGGFLLKNGHSFGQAINSILSEEVPFVPKIPRNAGFWVVGGFFKSWYTGYFLGRELEPADRGAVCRTSKAMNSSLLNCPPPSQAAGSRNSPCFRMSGLSNLDLCRRADNAPSQALPFPLPAHLPESLCVHVSCISPSRNDITCLLRSNLTYAL